MKKIEDFNGYYITETGEVFSTKYGKMKKLKPKTEKGYKCVTLSKGKRDLHKKLIHRLVAEAFIPNPEGKPCVDHINGIRDDNRVENLRWCTQKENNTFPLARKNKSVSKMGDKNPMYGKEHTEDCRRNISKMLRGTEKVLQIDVKTGDVVAIYYSLMEAERKTGIPNSNISACCLKKPHFLTAGGYKWRYE